MSRKANSRAVLARAATVAVAAVMVGALLGAGPVSAAATYLTKQVANKLYVNVGEKASNSDKLDGKDFTEFASAAHGHDAGDITGGTLADGLIPSAIARDAEVMATVLGSDGPGSGVDADTVDGLGPTDLVAQTAGGSNTNNFVLTDTWQNVASATIALPARAAGTNYRVTATGTAGLFTASSAPLDNFALCVLTIARSSTVSALSFEYRQYQAGANADFVIPATGSALVAGSTGAPATVSLACREVSGSNVAFDFADVTVIAHPA